LGRTAAPGRRELAYRDPIDRISILTDKDGDGVMDTKKIFADKLELATSFVPYKQGVTRSVRPQTSGFLVAHQRR